MPYQVQGRRQLSLVVATSISLMLAGSLAAAHATAAPSPKPASCAPERGVTPSTVKVGIIYPKTGAAAPSFVDFDKAVQLRFDQENAKGGVFGRKLTNVVYDDQGSGATQTDVGNKAVQQDGVFGIVTATVVTTMFPMLKAANIPVTGLSNQLPFGTDRNAFGASGAFASTIQSTAQADRLKAAGATKIAMINHATSGAANGSNAVAKTLPVVGLTDILHIADAPQGAYDGTAIALRTKSSGADGVYYNGFVDGGISTAQAYKQQGYMPKILMLAGLVDPAVVAQTGDLLTGENVVGSTYGTVPSTVSKPAVRTYVNAFKAAHLNPYSAIAPIGYVAADAFIRGLKVAGPCLTHSSFIEQLRKVNDFDGHGMLPAPISWRPGLTPNGDPARCAWFAVAKNGTLVPDAKAVCGKFVDTATGQIVG